MMVNLGLHHLHLQLWCQKESATPTYVTRQGCMTRVGHCGAIVKFMTSSICLHPVAMSVLATCQKLL